METETNQIVSNAPVSFTASALKEIKTLAIEEGKNTLRIGAKNGGCSGFSYIFEFDDVTEQDLTFEIENITLIIDQMHLLHIKGVTVDYEQGLNNRGFTFTNPNASETCGCGTSFS